MASEEGQASLRTDGDEGRVGITETLGGGALSSAAEGSLGSLTSPSPAEIWLRPEPPPMPLGWQTLHPQQNEDKKKKKGKRG